MEFGILGPVEVRDNGRDVSLGGLKQRALLAILASQANKIVSSEALIDLIWGDDAPETAKHSLEVYVSQLRKLLESTGPKRLGKSVLIRRAPGYLLQLEAEELDLTRFQRLVEQARTEATAGEHEAASDSLRQALALWRGPALVEFASSRLGLGEGARLNELRLRALEERFECDLHLGRHADLVGELEALLAEHPLRERLAGQLMLALYRSGRQAEASDVYQQIRAKLTDEVGVDPGRELQLLLKRILTQDPVLDLTPRWQPSETNRIAGKLPTPLTTFVGRAHDIVGITESLVTGRLITLVGPGGIGKTRLAVHVAHNIADRYPAGVYFLPLASITDAELVPETLAHVMGITERHNLADGALIIEHIGGRGILLVIDNCEHLVEAVAPLIRRLLEACPNLQILATSREPLGIGGETAYHVEPLAIPDSFDSHELSKLAANDCVHLFCDRANAIKRQFQLSKANADAVAAICQRLDGIPLAIELAAARVGILTPDEIAKRLHDRFTFLRSGDRTAPARHQTLRAMIDWSHNLLSEVETIAFRRLAVFTGRFTLASAEAVLGDRAIPSHEVLTILARLVERSLLISVDEPSHIIFDQLETIRQYGLEKLRESGESEVVRRRMLDHYLRQSAIAAKGLDTAQEIQWTEWVGIELDNLRAAADASAAGPSEVHLTLTADIVRLMNRAGHVNEARARIESVLESNPSPSVGRGRCLFRAATLASIQGQPDVARAYAEESLALGLRFHDTKCQTEALFQLAHSAYTQGKFELALPYLLRGLALARDDDDANAICYFENAIGEHYLRLGELERAAEHLNASLDLARELEVPMWIGDAANNLAVLFFEMGEVLNAAALNAEAITCFERLHDNLKIAGCLETSALIASKAGHGERGLALMKVAESLRVAEGTPAPDWVIGILQTSVATDLPNGQSRYGAEDSLAAMTLAEALQLARNPLRASDSSGHPITVVDGRTKR